MGLKESGHGATAAVDEGAEKVKFLADAGCISADAEGSAMPSGDRIDTEAQESGEAATAAGGSGEASAIAAGREGGSNGCGRQQEML